jgi:hypothetical protein
MTTSHGLVALSNVTATLVSTPGTHSGADITIQNIDDTAIVYIGGEGVTAASYGFKLTPGAAWSVELAGKDHLYAISDTDASEVAILKVSLESQD